MANIIGQRIAMPQIAAPQAAQAQLLQVPADAPPAVGSLGGLFQGLAGPFMDTASRDYKNAETARALLQGSQLRQGIQGKQSLADFVRGGGDIASNPALANAILGDVSAANLAGYRRSQVYDDQGNPVGGDIATRASLAAGEPFASTVAGTNQAEANRLLINDLITKRQAAAQERAAQITAQGRIQEAGLEPVQGVDANGNPVWTTKAAIGGGTAPAGYSPAQSEDQVKALLLRQWIGGGAPSGPSAPAAPALTTTAPATSGDTLDVNAPIAAPTAAPTAPRQSRDLSQMPYPLQKIMGIATDAIPYTEVSTNVVGQSFDGGRTITLPSGKVVDATSGQWVRGDPTTATGEARTAIAKQQAAAPSQYAGANPLQGDIARAALTASGLPAAVRSHANALVGAVTGGALPELDPQTERARQTLAIFDQTIKPALLNSAAKGSREQAIVQGMLPSGSAFENPETVARNVGQIHAYLLQQNGIIRNVIQSTASPQILQDYQQRLAENEAALAAITQGAAGRAAAGRPAPAAPAAPTAAPTAPAKLPAGVTADQAIAEAQSAIKANPAAREAIMGRLRNWGLDLNTAQPGTTGGTF
jgi:hypothetical protein